MVGPIARRWAASLAGLGLLAAMAALYLLAPAGVYQAVLWGFGVEPFRFPFIDIDYYLAAWDCTRQGWDALERIPCDVLGRGYASGPLWLDMAWWSGLGRADRSWIGLGLAVAFLLSLAALPWPGGVRAPGALVARVLAGISPVVVFALERANFDVPLFLLAVAAAALLARGGAAGWGGYALIWLMAALKYYPAALLAVALREPARRFAWVALASLAVLGLYVAWNLGRILRSLALVPGGRVDTDMFSARNLPLNIGLLVWKQLEGGGGEILASLAVMAVVLLLLAWGCARGVARRLRSEAFAAALGRLDACALLCLLLACAAMLGCFFTAQNIAYRAVYLLLALPALSHFAWGEGDALVRASGRRGVWLVVFVLWGECLRHAINLLTTGEHAPEWNRAPLALAFWLARELAWWWLVMLMAAVLARFAWDAPVTRALRRRRAG